MQERGFLSLTRVALDRSATVTATGGGSLSLVECSGYLNELTVTDSFINIDTSTSEHLTLGKIELGNVGAVALTGSTFEQSVTVTGDTHLDLSGCTLREAVRLTASGGGSLSIASMEVPAGVLFEARIHGAGSTLRLDAISIPGSSDIPTELNGWPLGHTGPASLGAVAWTKTRGPDGHVTVDGPDFGVGPVFTVTSGSTCTNYDGHLTNSCLEYDNAPPCAVSEGGRCVGRPEGYGPWEECVITVGGGGGVLAPCPVFDLPDPHLGGDMDGVTLPGGVTYWGSSHTGDDGCPAGAALAPGDVLTWASNIHDQGSDGRGGSGDREDGGGCRAKGTCGLPFSYDGLGGGWQLCFAR